ncbi:MAG: RDD family protein [Solirubrobacteraceae bacterium MAG38_C4-C5]|nr:RDD family protein [Candidatus Siliceabacter maunaloa]
MAPGDSVLDDRVAIATPEGVELELTLAGLGSRAIAGGIDLAIKGLLIGLLALALLATGVLGVTLLIPVIAIVLLGYDIAFETLAQGRTPGKRMAGLRVVREGGGPVDISSSAIRNVVRLVDGLPLSYAPTIVSIAVTRRNQRPGDLVAGTLVVRERLAATTVERADQGPDLEEVGWDVSAVDGHQMAMVRSFLARRDGLRPAARERLAEQLAAGLRPRVGGADEDDAESFLELLDSEKARRGG